MEGERHRGDETEDRKMADGIEKVTTGMIVNEREENKRRKTR